MILGVTLARGGSKGVPGKHLRVLGDLPLVDWTFREAEKSRLDAYAVSSDDERILARAQRYGAFVIQRPPALAQDDTPTLPALLHAIADWEAENGRADYVVEIRATSPLKTAADIDGCIELLTQHGADSVIGVTRLEDHHPARAKRLCNGYIRDFIPEPESGRRQDLKPEAYVRNGTVYAFRRDYIVNGGRLFGNDNCLAYIMPPERSVNIDTELDWLVAKALVNG